MGRLGHPVLCAFADGSFVFHGRLTAEQGALLVKAVEKAMDTLWENAPGENAQGEDAPDVSAETLARLSCDASVVVMHEDRDGNPLNIGRKSRSIPPALRRALKFRDGGCRFPGCTAKRFVDGHHIRHWSHGGETRLDNLVLLCRHHHRLVHEGGFEVRRDRDGGLRFSRPDRSVIAEAADGVAIEHPPKLTRLPRARLRVRLMSWNGEPMDYDIALEALWQFDSRLSEISRCRT